MRIQAGKKRGVVSVEIAAVDHGRRHALAEWLIAGSMLVLARPLLTVAFLAAVALAVSQRPWPLLALLFGLPLLARTRHKAPFAGHLVRQSGEPELMAFVRQVAEHAGFAEPLVVRIIPVPDASIAPTRLGGRRGFALALGWPFLRYLSAQQLAALIAHELGHYRQGDDRRRRWLLSARERLVERQDRRFHAPRFMVDRLLTRTQSLSWQLEFRADLDSARVAGAAATRDALRTTRMISEAFDHYAEWWFPVFLDNDTYPADFFSAVEEAIADPYVRRHLEGRVDLVDRFPQVADSHPPSTARAEMLPQSPPAARFGDEPVVVRTREDLDRWAVEQLLPVPAASLRPAKVTEIDSDRLLPSVDEARNALEEATREVTGESALEASLAAVRNESQWRAIADRLDPDLRHAPQDLRAAAQRETLANCLLIVVVGALANAGWESATRWAINVRVDPQTGPVDVREVLERAIDDGDPTPVRALLQRATPDETAVTS